MNNAKAESLCVTPPFLKTLIVLTANILDPSAAHVNSYPYPSAAYGCKHEIRVYVNFTSPLAFQKCHSEGPTCQTLRVSIAFSYFSGKIFISPAQAFLMSKHVYKVMISGEICPADFRLLVNMFYHLSHCKHSVHNHVCFFFFLASEDLNATHPPLPDTCLAASPQYYINRCHIMLAS